MALNPIATYETTDRDGRVFVTMRASLLRWLTDDGKSRLPDHVSYCVGLMEDGLGQVSRPR